MLHHTDNMWKRLRYWLSDTSIDDPLEQRQAVLLQVVLLGLASIFGIAAIATLLEAFVAQADSTGSPPNIFANFLALLLCLAPLILLRRGHFRAAVVLTMAVFFLLAAALLAGSSFYHGGILLAIAPLILAALLLNRRAVLITFAGSVLLVSIMANAHQSAPPLLSPYSFIGNFTLIGGMLALFLDRFGAALREALAATREREGQLEAEIRSRALVEERLKQSEARLRALIENANEAIWSIDTEYRVLTFNSFCREQLLLVSGKQIEAGMRWEELLAPGAPPEHAGYWRDLYDRALAGEIVRVEQQDECQGQTRFAIISLYPISADGAISGVSVFSRDITEHKRLEEQLVQSQKMEGIGQLAGGIAHDFNNLLTAIIGNLSLGLDTLPRDHHAHGDIVESLGAAKRAAGLTRQLLAFARKQIMTPQVLDLNALILDMQSLLQRLLGADIALITHPFPALWRVKADAGQIEQVIVNLVVNARDAMPQGGRITLETRNIALEATDAHQHLNLAPGSYVLLMVSDTGVGMDEQVRQRIFEPFFTTKEPGRGTGLGLAMCYGIVQQHGGAIWVASTLGHGSVFHIYLPRIDEPDQRLARNELPRTLPNGTETILIVEDEPAVGMLAARVLRAQGYTVLVTTHPDEALAIVRAQTAGSIDLLLTDVVMPGMSGKTLAEHVRRLSPASKTLYMSGYADSATVHHSQHPSDGVFLTKPFSPDSLVRKVRDILDS